MRHMQMARGCLEEVMGREGCGSPGFSTRKAEVRMARFPILPPAAHPPRGACFFPLRNEACDFPPLPASENVFILEGNRRHGFFRPELRVDLGHLVWPGSG